MKQVEDKHSCSLVEYIEIQKKINEQLRLKDIITEDMCGHYFNYELTTQTWNLLVNKQIYMKFERLFVEKQLKEVEKKERELK